MSRPGLFFWGVRFLTWGASLQLAVILMLVMLLLLALGTWIESYYDAQTAQVVIYSAWWTRLLFTVFALNLIFVMITRLPWQKKHLDFLSAHVGILLILFGSLLTAELGVDGIMRLERGSSSDEAWQSQIDLPYHELLVYEKKSNDYTLLYKLPLVFHQLMQTQVKKNLPVPLVGSLFLSQIMPKAELKMVKVASNNPADAPAMTLEIYNQISRQNISLGFLADPKNPGLLKAEEDLGPLRVSAQLGGSSPLALANCHEKSSGQQEAHNRVLIWNEKTDFSAPWKAFVCARSEKSFRWLNQDAANSAQPGLWTLPWMNFKLRIGSQWLHSREKMSAQEFSSKLGQADPENQSKALRLTYQKAGGREGLEYDLALDQAQEIELEQRTFLFFFRTRSIDLGLALSLHEFGQEFYAHTSKAREYFSNVKIKNAQGQVSSGRLSMNQPLKFERYTFYQNAFENDAQGKPQASILSVNYDPGRPWKYAGCVFLIFGIIWMFKSRNMWGKNSFKVAAGGVQEHKHI